MNTKMHLLAALVAATLAVPAAAGVTAEEAKALGTTLTPLGADKNASKDGTIPAWTGGLTTPRPAAEIRTSPEGRRVLTAAGDDVTDAFERGAAAAAAACAALGIRVAILKDGSPSCGSATIDDGTFSGRRIRGVGLTAARLASQGVTVFREDQIDEAARHVDWLDATGERTRRLAE